MNLSTDLYTPVIKKIRMQADEASANTLNNLEKSKNIPEQLILRQRN